MSLFKITVVPGWTRYVGKIRADDDPPIDPGDYYRVELGFGPDKDKWKKMLGLTAARDPNGRFVWLAPHESWVKRVWDGTWGVKKRSVATLNNWFDWAKLRDWQLAAVKQIVGELEQANEVRQLFNVGFGGGKTLVGLIASMLGESTLVLAPTQAHETWKSEAEKWEMQAPFVSTYESAHKWSDQDWDVLLLDECFPQGELVHTKTGLKPIEEVSIGEEVWSYNGTGLELKRVTDVLMKCSRNDIVKVSIGKKVVYLTDNHKIWSVGDDAYKEARAIDGEDVLVLRESVSVSIKRDNKRYKSESMLPQMRCEAAHETNEDSKSMRRVFKRVCDTNKKRGGEVGKGSKQILFSSLCGQVENETAREEGAKQEEHTEGDRSNSCPNTGRVVQNMGREGEKTHTRDDCKVERIARSFQANNARWKRNRTNSGRGGTDGKDTCGSSPRFSSLYRASPRKVCVAEACENRLGISVAAHSHRSRRRIARLPESQRTGCEKRLVSKRIRLERISVEEQRNNSRFQQGATVYCLSVADNHNFLVGEVGLLVSNCHKVKSSDTARHKHTAKIAARTPIVLGFTGSPMGGGGVLDLRQLRCISPGSFPANETAIRFLFGLDTKLEEVAEGRKAYVTKTWNTKKLAEFVEPFITTVDTTDLINQLPPKTETIVKLPRPRDYHLVMSGASTSRNRSKLTAQLRQATDGFVEMDDGRVVELSDKAKLEWVVEQIEHNDEPVMIVAAWTHTIELLQNELAPYQPAVLTGMTKDKSSEIERFKRGSTRVMLLNAKLSEGMNLQMCRQIWFLSLSSNPVDLDQMIARCFRPGQTQGVQAVFLQCEDTLDERAYELVTKHKELSAEAIEKLLEESMDVKDTVA